LRVEHGFHGYIHLKTIPDADPELIREAGRYADRLSINVEFARAATLSELAPEKDGPRIDASMQGIAVAIAENRDDRKRLRHVPRFAPAGQSTQMIVGADAAPDVEILERSARLYDNHRLKRVYYSAYSPIADGSVALPARPPPLLREHRLYQADWLIRFYEFSAQEITATARSGMLDLANDPKTAWALQHPEYFPLDVNRASREQLLRVPGIGTRSAGKLLSLRRLQRMRLAAIAAIVPSIEKVKPFIVARDWRPRATAQAGATQLRLAL
jgi:predicted DNA-binding helix-hairpin-helix protein